MLPARYRRSLGLLVALAAGAAAACSEPTAPGLKAAPTLATKPPSTGGTIPTFTTQPQPLGTATRSAPTAGQ